eukprot:Nk52_evm43s242 gene=Nk52_evmTU43s242
MEEIRSYWEVPYINFFCSIFRDIFRIPDFDIQAFEILILRSSSEDPEWKKLHLQLLKNLSYAKRATPENWVSVLRDQYFIRDWEKKNPLDGKEYDDLTIYERIVMLKALCDWKAGDLDSSKANAEGLSAADMRLFPIGFDSKACSYYHFRDMRLYKEEPLVDPAAKTEAGDGKKKKKKRAGAFGSSRRRGKKKGQTRVQQVVAEEEDKKSDSSASKDGEEGSEYGGSVQSNEESVGVAKTPGDGDGGEEGEEDGGNSAAAVNDTQKEGPFGRWSLVCETPAEWEELGKQFSTSRHVDEKTFGKYLLNDVVPELYAMAKEHEKYLRKQFLATAPPSRSSARVAKLKMEQQSSDVTNDDDGSNWDNSRDLRNRTSGRRTETREERNQRRELNKDIQLNGEHPSSSSRSVGSGREQKTSKRTVQSNDEEVPEVAFCKRLWKSVMGHKKAWPFIEPVPVELVPDYLDVIKEPMDLTTLGGMIDDGTVTNPSQCIEKIFLILNNCRTYNKPDTVYYKCADAVEVFVNKNSEKLKKSLGLLAEIDDSAVDIISDETKAEFGNGGAGVVMHKQEDIGVYVPEQQSSSSPRKKSPKASSSRNLSPKKSSPKKKSPKKGSPLKAILLEKPQLKENLAEDPAPDRRITEPDVEIDILSTNSTSKEDLSNGSLKPVESPAPVSKRPVSPSPVPVITSKAYENSVSSGALVSEKPPSPKPPVVVSAPKSPNTTSAEHGTGPLVRDPKRPRLSVDTILNHDNVESRNHPLQSPRYEQKSMPPPASSSAHTTPARTNASFSSPHPPARFEASPMQQSQPNHPNTSHSQYYQPQYPSSHSGTYRSPPRPPPSNSYNSPNTGYYFSPNGIPTGASPHGHQPLPMSTPSPSAHMSGQFHSHRDKAQPPRSSSAAGQPGIAKMSTLETIEVLSSMHSGSPQPFKTSAIPSPGHRSSPSKPKSNPFQAPLSFALVFLVISLFTYTINPTVPGC